MLVPTVFFYILVESHCLSIFLIKNAVAVAIAFEYISARGSEIVMVYCSIKEEQSKEEQSKSRSEQKVRQKNNKGKQNDE